MTTLKQLYTERMIRAGYSAVDVNMWQQLLRKCETDETGSVTHLRALLDLSQHLRVEPLQVIKTGRELCKEKCVNDAFLEAIYSMVDESDYEDFTKAKADPWKPKQVPGGNGDSGTVNKDIKPKQAPGGNGDSGTVNKDKKPVYSTGVLDLTCDEDSESGSYEETDEVNDGYYEYDADPNSAEAYEIDGFVVPDHPSQPTGEPYDDIPSRAGKRKLTAIIEAN